MTDHPNKAQFIGCLTVIEKPSDKPPAGARGHRIVITAHAAEKALPSLIGMAVDYREGWDGHDNRRKFGVIEKAYFRGYELMVEGHLWRRDFPQVVKSIQASAERFGMSYELHDVRVEDMRAEVWTVTRLTFVGAAVLYKDKAAYKETEFVIV